MTATSSIVAAAFLATAFSVSAHAEDLAFGLINETDVAITGFYVSPADSNNWESNLMSGGYLDGGYEIDVLIQDGLSTCVYDIRADFEDGEIYEDYDLNLCDLGAYTFE